MTRPDGAGGPPPDFTMGRDGGPTATVPSPAPSFAPPPDWRETPPSGLPPLSSEALDALEAILRDDPNAVEFFQAVRLLERTRPDRAPVGGFGFGPLSSAAFSPPSGSSGVVSTGAT